MTNSTNDLTAEKGESHSHSHSSAALHEISSDGENRSPTTPSGSQKLFLKALKKHPSDRRRTKAVTVSFGTTAIGVSNATTHDNQLDKDNLSVDKSPLLPSVGDAEPSYVGRSASYAAHRNSNATADIDDELVSDNDTASHGGTTDGTETVASNGSLQSLIDGRKKTWIPFEVRVSMAMAIPVIFLVVSIAMQLSDAVAQNDKYEAQTSLLDRVNECCAAVQLERAYSSLVVVGNSSSRWRVMLSARTSTDDRCDDAEHEANQSDNPEITGGYLEDLRAARSALVGLRVRIDENRIATSRLRETFGTLVARALAVYTMLQMVPELQQMAVDLGVLKLMQDLRSILGAQRAAGGEVLSYKDTNTLNTSAWTQVTVVGEFLEAESREGEIDQALLDSNHPRAERYVRQSWNSSRVKSAWAVNAALRADPLSVRNTSNQYFTLIGWALTDRNLACNNATLGIAQDVRDRLSKEVTVQAVLMSLALVLSLVAAAFVIRTQMRTNRAVDAALAHSKRMQRAISAFVPRSFLKLTGCTSILQVSAGEQSEVAVSLLFSDIRNFTGISERMTNEELFIWIQKYAARLTRITESNKGFVDKMIGDAIFSVFMSPACALQCGIDMQTSTGQLNLEIIAAGGKDLIQIGVGIHHAAVTAGFLGDRHRLTATMISAQVNLASRLEGLTKMYGAKILISEAAFDHVAANPNYHFESRRIGEVKVKGSGHSLPVVEVYQADEIELKEHKANTKDIWERGVAMRTQGDVEGSNRFFEMVKASATKAGIVDAAVDVKLAHSERADQFFMK